MTFHVARHQSQIIISQLPLVANSSRRLVVLIWCNFTLHRINTINRWDSCCIISFLLTLNTDVINIDLFAFRDINLMKKENKETFFAIYTICVIDECIFVELFDLHLKFIVIKNDVKVQRLCKLSQYVTMY